MKKIVSIMLIFAMMTVTVSCSKNDNKSEKNIVPDKETAIENVDTNGNNIEFVAQGDYFYHNDNKKWNRVILKGVNMGLTLATTNLNNPDVSYETYMEWFEQISEMNAKTVKVFTIMNPDFYQAFYDYNKKAESPLYLIQGIWFNEDYLYDVADALDADNIVADAFERNITETIDIIHGNSDYTSYGNIKNAVYHNDISKYVAGYILGLEWPAEFVQNTNSHTDRKAYFGEYLENTNDATPFESFLCEMGDKLISYETQSYKMQIPVAFLNWQTTDTLKHSNEPFEEEDSVSVNTENIKSNESYKAGLFAALDIYPYYPEFMNHQKEYVDYKDSNGQSNPYEAYLIDLKKEYTVPVMVAEVGLPTSRGVAHESVVGYNQGGLTEKQQGEYLTNLLTSIYKSGYAGSMIFSWQEEWFKQTWNTVKYAPENPECRTPNVMSAEQGYGIVAVEPGENQICKIDGKLDEWSDSENIIDSDEYKLYSKYDEGYLYLAVQLKSKTDGKIYVPISTLGVGSQKDNTRNITFDKNTDFVLEIDENGETRLLADSYYSTFHYIYGYSKGVFDFDNDYSVKNSGEYVRIQMFTSNEMYLPDDNKTIEPQFYESGLLKSGITDPDSDKFDNTADYYIADNTMEFRIPWYLLNVMNSTQGTVINDFYSEGSINFTDVQEINIGIGKTGDNIELKSIPFEEKQQSSYHTRLKKSYKILKKYLKEIG